MHSSAAFITTLRLTVAEWRGERGKERRKAPPLSPSPSPLGDALRSAPRHQRNHRAVRSIHFNSPGDRAAPPGTLQGIPHRAPRRRKYDYHQDRKLSGALESVDTRSTIHPVA